MKLRTMGKPVFLSVVPRVMRGGGTANAAPLKKLSNNNNNMLFVLRE